MRVNTFFENVRIGFSCYSQREPGNVIISVKTLSINRRLDLFNKFFG
jgi:hypothetical protein